MTQSKRPATKEEIAAKLTLCKLHNPTVDDFDERLKRALANGYKNEICLECGTTFLAFHHLVKCTKAFDNSCPMVAKGEPTLLERTFEGPTNADATGTEK
jgi:hypothetical protein